MINMKYNFLTIMVLLIFSCSITKVKLKEEIKENINNNIYGRKFKLVSTYPEINITIEFNENRVFGFSGVNNYFASYSIDGDIFNILNISKTKKTSTKKEEDIENKYINTIKNATSFKLDGKKLIIYTLLSNDNLIFEEI